MSYATLIRQIEAGEGLGFVDARALGAALLDGGVPELETAAFLVAFNQHDPGLDAWLGLHAALAERLPGLAAPPGPFRTVVLPAYRGVRRHPHLTPLLALLLKSFGIPVLVHGVLEGGGGTAAAYVLRELGVMPCGTAAQVNAKLLEEGIAFAPVALLTPGLAALLALRAADEQGVDHANPRRSRIRIQRIWGALGQRQHRPPGRIEQGKPQSRVADHDVAQAVHRVAPQTVERRRLHDDVAHEQ